ncbi:MAG: membrane protein insertase YidC, partial [Candidatus Omnitrophica bacterium]|nr:membrane protein insertase YidC [Candidatus Omnitrophota bacterium]
SLETDRYEMGITGLGGSINSVKIKNGDRFDTDLVDGAIYDAGLFAIEGKGDLSGLSSQQFAMKEDKRGFYIDKNGLAIEKNIRFLKDRYALTVAIKITNKTSTTKNLSFDITTASNIAAKERYESRYIGADVFYKDGKLKKIASGNFKKHNRLYNNNPSWLVLRNKYYSIITMPEFVPAGVFTKSINGSPVAGFIVEDEKILPGATKQYNFLVYIGPTELGELEKTEVTFGKALNFGIFTSISLILLSVLKFFYGLSHNYGVAILLLTGCVSLLLYPLTLKSLKSMRGLQKLQPHMEQLRAEHKDNAQKLNKEIMELYRRHKVNPMGGCFPIFLQMPIFIALYQTLMRSVELKGANFLWIKDLSMPDAAFALPFNMPFLGNTINLLPILMIGAMIIQQKLSSASTGAAPTEQQKIMTAVMPVMFGFIFYSLPSGLVLYWLTNTLIQSSLQYFIVRKT